MDETSQNSVKDDHDGDLAKRAVDFLQKTTDTVVSLPPFKITRSFLSYLASGIFALIVLPAVFILSIIALTKVFNVYVFSGRVWATYLLFGTLFFVTGILLARRAK
jgi:hypothetical protein